MTILARLRGTIEEKTAEAVLMFVGGLGFGVQVPRSTLTSLPEVGEEATLRTHLYVREGTLGLYGFAWTAAFVALATSSTVKPSGTFILLTASCGE